MKAKRHLIINDNNDGEEKDDELGNHNGLGCDQIDVKSKKTKKKTFNVFLKVSRTQKNYLWMQKSFKIKITLWNNLNIRAINISKPHISRIIQRKCRQTHLESAQHL